MLKFSRAVSKPVRRRESLVKAVNSGGYERRIGAVVNQSFPLLDESLYSDTARRMIQARSTDGLINAMPWQEFIQALGATSEPMKDAIQAMQGMELRSIGAVQAGMRMDAIDAISRKYAQEQSSKLIVDITDSQRATIRGILGQALGGQLTVDQTARRIREGIGLHPAWAQAVQNYRGRLEANPRPTGVGPARHQENIDRSVARYRDRLVRVRSQNIARTEIMRAENTGRYAGWAQSIGLGYNSADSRKEWAPGPGACKVCAPMAGEVVGWDKPFSNGVLMPPAHPSCRCTANLLPPQYQTGALNPRPINWTDAAGDFAGTPDLSQYMHGYDLLDTAGAAAGDLAGVPTGEDTTDEPTAPETDGQGFPDYTALAEEEGVAADQTLADTLTYESTMHLSDDELAAKLTDLADDPEAVDKILEIMDQRDLYATDIEAQMAAMDAKLLAEEQAKEQAAREWFKANIVDEDPVTNPAVRPERKLTKKQQVAEEYSNYVDTQYMKALNDLNGVLLNKAGKEAAKLNPDLELNIFSGQIATAKKYASEELMQWWRENGRETLGSFRYRALQMPSDKWYADIVRREGFERGTAARDRSTF